MKELSLQGHTFGRRYCTTGLNLLPEINIPGSSAVKLMLKTSF